ncbi:hypothetical protein LK518_22470, partial [Parabacteroides distasonis]|uniref:hypothetical protein n=1 Tax=Parabacteroides distasonis TaxID=823 RepID=UPI001D11CE86
AVPEGAAGTPPFWSEGFRTEVIRGIDRLVLLLRLCLLYRSMTGRPVGERKMTLGRKSWQS